MELNRLFDMLERARDKANWRAAFGEPETIDGKTIIPVAQVIYGYGLGFGTGSEPAGPAQEVLPADEAAPEEMNTGAGGGGGGQVKPLGAIVVSPDGVDFEESVDSTKVAVAAFLMIAWSIYQINKTLRAIFGRS